MYLGREALIVLNEMAIAKVEQTIDCALPMYLYGSHHYAFVVFTMHLFLAMVTSLHLAVAQY